VTIIPIAIMLLGGWGAGLGGPESNDEVYRIKEIKMSAD